MTIVPISYAYPLYIKKEDAREVVKRQRMVAGFVLICITIVMAIMQFLVAPKLLNFYNSINTKPPLLTQISPYLMLVIGTLAIIAALYFLLSKPDYSTVDSVVSKYKEGEMIKTRELMDNKFEWLVLGVFAIMIIYLVTTLILPIYSLTSNFN